MASLTRLKVQQLREAVRRFEGAWARVGADFDAPAKDAFDRELAAPVLRAARQLVDAGEEFARLNDEIARSSATHRRR